MSLLLKKFAPGVLCLVVVMSSGCASSSGIGPSIKANAESGVSASAPDTLIACPNSPNCVSSIATDANKLAAAFDLTDAEPSTFQAKLVSAIEADGGVVKEVREGYVWATYTSSVFRFVDDIEWLLNSDATAFDVRSASRVGYSDFGVNAKRVERLRRVVNP